MRFKISLVLTAVFIIGASAIVYYGRPIMKMNEANKPASEQTNNPVSAADQNLGPRPDTTNTIDVAVKTPTTNTQKSDVPKTVQKTTLPIPSAPETKPIPKPNTYTLAEVANHNTPENCWAAISGNVYDLTTWISRHPGGESPIKGLCGTDATAKFIKKHGDSEKAKAMLALLKIGTLE